MHESREIAVAAQAIYDLIKHLEEQVVQPLRRRVGAFLTRFPRLKDRLRRIERKILGAARSASQRMDDAPGRVELSRGVQRVARDLRRELRKCQNKAGTGQPAERTGRVEREFAGGTDAVAARLLVDRATQIAATATGTTATTRGAGHEGGRLRLAFVAPMPPERTGVATYAARLLPGLSETYDIDVITDQDAVILPPTSRNVSVRSVGHFAEYFQSYDRVLYHVGNNAFHAHMPALIRDCPGTVVLHDVYLGDLMYWLDCGNVAPGILQRSLIEGHGYGAVSTLARGAPHHEIFGRFQCNCMVVDEANGIIVHSRFAEALVAARFEDFAEVPVARAALARPVEAGDRDAARTRLNIADDEFIVASFGFVNGIKLHHRLVEAWTHSRLPLQGRARLIIVGEASESAYCQALQQQIAASAFASRIAITGYVDDATMADHLAACDIAVQLRGETRGETSGAALDCLAHGCAMITNASGSLAEIPEYVALAIASDFSDAELTAAMERLAADTPSRESLRRAATGFVATHHDPATVALQYTQAIERFAADGPRARYASTIAALAELSPDIPIDDAVLDALASAIASKLCRPGGAQLLIDVTGLVDNDLKTGIERVSRAVIQRLIDDPPDGMRVEPVRFLEGRFVYARRFMSTWIGLAAHSVDSDVEPRDGDAFLGLVWSPQAISLAHDELCRYRRMGVAVNVVVYDILPQQHPHWFPPSAVWQHRRWLATVCAVADRLLCISASVADDLIEWLDAHGPARTRPLEIAHFPLGCDIAATVPTTGVPPSAAEVLASIANRTAFLMVGAVEPRKGHRQAIEAFELLWRAGHAVALVIVGRRGWMTAEVETLVDDCIERGRRLIRLTGASDEFLESIYREADALLAASFGEGFGLPLIEAAHHELPVIARDIPVFREVAGDGAYYFRANTPAELAEAITSWIALAKAGAAPAPDAIPRRSWLQSVSLLMRAVDGRAGYKTWRSPVRDDGLEQASA